MQYVLRRWQQAQKAERLFWNSENTVQAEISKIVERYRPVFREIKSNKNDRILDLGCGPTVISRMMKGGEKYCVDPLMKHFVEKIHGISALASFHFLMGTGESLPFLTGCFDQLVCRNVLDHVLCPEEVLKEVKRVSKSSAVVVLGANVYSEFVVRLKEDLERFGVILLKEEYHPRFFTEKTFEGLCSEHFSVVKRRKVHCDDAHWIRIDNKTLGAQDQRTGEKRSKLYWTLSFCANLAISLFWNSVRLLNKTKASYFMIEYALVAHPCTLRSPTGAI